MYLLYGFYDLKFELMIDFLSNGLYVASNFVKSPITLTKIAVSF